MFKYSYGTIGRYPIVNAHYDSAKEILEADDILHENTEINTTAVENKGETGKSASCEFPVCEFPACELRVNINSNNNNTHKPHFHS